jgi:hypothetical protein
MTLVYEVPTHLNVEDQLLFGLSARQLVRLLAAGSMAYGVWDQATIVPDLVRGTLAGALSLFGLALAVVQPGGRPLDQWLVAVVLYVFVPHRFTWRLEPRLDMADDRTTGWADLVPLPGWVAAPAHGDNDAQWASSPERTQRPLRRSGERPS